MIVFFTVNMNINPFRPSCPNGRAAKSVCFLFSSLQGRA